MALKSRAHPSPPALDRRAPHRYHHVCQYPSESGIKERTPYSSIISGVRRIRGGSDDYLPAGLYVYGKHSHDILYFTPDNPDQMPDAP